MIPVAVLLAGAACLLIWPLEERRGKSPPGAALLRHHIAAQKLCTQLTQIPQSVSWRLAPPFASMAPPLRRWRLAWCWLGSRPRHGARGAVWGWALLRHAGAGAGRVRLHSLGLAASGAARAGSAMAACDSTRGPDTLVLGRLTLSAAVPSAGYGRAASTRARLWLVRAFALHIRQLL